MLSAEILMTLEGHMGLALPKARTNDIVRAFIGAFDPYVLRQRDGHFILVGYCYIRGMKWDGSVEQLNSVRRSGMPMGNHTNISEPDEGSRKRAYIVFQYILSTEALVILLYPRPSPYPLDLQPRLVHPL